MFESDSGIPSSRRGINKSTCLPHHFREVPLDVLGLEEAYARAKALHAARPVTTRGPGYRIFTVFRDFVGSIDLPLHDDAYVVVGRHTACDVYLGAEPTLALRHLLVRCVRTEDSAVGVRIMDLNTSLTFYVDDGGPCRSIFAVGPIAIRVGPYAVVALPFAADALHAQVDALPARLPKPEIARATKLPVSSPYRQAGMLGGERAFRSSHVTILPSLPGVEQLAAARSGAPSDPYARLVVDRGNRMVTVPVMEAELDAGVLIGRADKCKDGGLRAALDESVSRAHLLFLRENGKTHAFDLCSTQGTYAYGRRLRRVELADTGTQLALGVVRNVRLDWRVLRPAV